MALHRCFLERVLQAHVQLFRIRRGEHPTGVFPRSTSYGSLHEIGVGPALSALPSIATRGGHSLRCGTAAGPTRHRQAACVDRLEACLAPGLDQAEVARLKHAIGLLRATNRIRVAAQHSGAGSTLPSAFALLGGCSAHEDWWAEEGHGGLRSVSVGGWRRP